MGELKTLALSFSWARMFFSIKNDLFVCQDVSGPDGYMCGVCVVCFVIVQLYSIYVPLYTCLCAQATLHSSDSFSSACW